MKTARRYWREYHAEIVSFAVLILVGVLAWCAVDNRTAPEKGPSGRITNKMWVQEFWQNGEQLYPARWCLELNYQDEVCIPEVNWNNYSVGEWYK